MKLLSALMFFAAATAFGQENRGLAENSQPMLLCYAVTSSSKDLLQGNKAVVTRQPDRQFRLIRVENRNGQAVSFPEIPPMEDDSAQMPSLKILAGDFCYSERPLPFSQSDLQEPVKFSMDNLMRGTVFDFKKQNRLRLETGGPTGRPNADLRYEEPFCVAVFLRFNIGGD